jgi:hypothetical protein
MEVDGKIQVTRENGATFAGDILTGWSVGGAALQWIPVGKGAGGHPNLQQLLLAVQAASLSSRVGVNFLRRNHLGNAVTEMNLTAMLNTDSSFQSIEKEKLYKHPNQSFHEQVEAHVGVLLISRFKS